MSIKKDFLQSIKTMVSRAINSATYDKIYNAQIIKVGDNNTYDIRLNGEEYSNVATYGKCRFNINDIVKVMFPQNQTSQMFILGNADIFNMPNTFNGETIFNNKVDINREATFDGETIFNNKVDINSEATFNDKVGFNDETAFDNKVEFNSETTFNGASIFNGDTLLNNNKMLWQGTAYMFGSQTVTLSEPVSAQTNGIVLVFSEYSGGAAHNWDFYCYFIPKAAVRAHAGVGYYITYFTSNFTYAISKYLYVSDNVIQGNDMNTKSGTGATGVKYNNSAAVLRHVIGV